VIALSCGIKISAVRHLVLSQYTRVTDGQTDERTDRIALAIAYRALHYMQSHGKNHWVMVVRIFGYWFLILLSLIH